MKTIVYLSFNTSSFGYHGYTVTDTPVKQFSLPADFTLTEEGYGDKVKGPNKVSVGQIFDGFCVHGEVHANSNDAEVAAVAQSLKKLVEFAPASRITLYVESGFVIRALKDWVSNWELNQWKKRDGAVISFAKDFKTILSLQSQSTIEIKQTPLLYGFTFSALLLKIAANRSEQQNTHYDSFSTTPVERYYKKESSEPTLFFYPKIYALTRQDSEHNIYVVGKPSADDKGYSVLGRKGPTTAWGVVILPKPSNALTSIIERLMDYDQETATLVAIDAKLSLRPAVQDALTNYGKYCLSRFDNVKLDLVFGEETTKLAEEFTNLQHTILFYNEAKGLLAHMSSLDSGLYERTSLVPLLFDPVKTTLQLKKEIGVGYTTLTLPEGFYRKPHKLILGIDLPDRNTLKRLEQQIEVMDIINTTKEEPLKRYFIYIELKDGSKGFFQNHTSLLV